MKNFRTLSDITNVKNSIMAGFDRPSFSQQRRLQKGQNDDLQKGHIVDAFGYGDDKLKIEKTGKEIKAKLTPMQVEYQAEKSELKNKMDRMKEIVGEEPTRGMEDYEFRGVKIDDPPKSYEWRKTEYEDVESKPMIHHAMIAQSTPAGAQSKEKAEAANKYNNYRYKYLELCAEIAFIEMMQRNISDTIKYSLNAKQATALGF